MYRVVLCTVPVDDAAGLARKVVESGLGACVNIVAGISSIYRWEGEIHDDLESLLIIKTTGEQIESLTKYLRAEHRYEVPEVVSLLVQEGEGNPEYLSWLSASVGSK